MQKKLTVFSFFSGIGILDLAFERNGYNIVFVNEYDHRFISAYQYARQQMHLNTPIYGYHNDSAERYAKRRGKRNLIELIAKEREKGNVVGFIGGPPCPDFSVAGKNAGASGKNGRLTKVYFDIICRCKPDFFLFENVKGLVKTEKHRVFYNEMKRKVQANNYLFDDKIINSLAYGVPQFRERAFMIGINKDIFRVVPNFFSFDWDRYSLFNTENILARKWPTTRDFEVDGSFKFIFPDIPQELTVEYWFDKNDVIHHINGNDVFTVKKGREKIATIQEGDTSRKSFKRLHRWRYSPTAAYGHNEVHLHPYKERRISVAEAMAIQSIPKEFIVLPMLSLSDKFKMIGNGVPYLMAAAIAKTLKETLKEIQEGNNETNRN
ncbi:MAG: DNA cytosine methyltransferase [Eubacterium sp.]|nr:DNA cytosine methyltransferase [Eubacterium sp.]